MNKKLFTLFLMVLSIAVAYGTTTGQIPDPSRPMPYTDFLEVDSTGQASIATLTQILTTTDGGHLTIHNESGDMLRIGTDANTLTNGFGLPAGAFISVRFHPRSVIYLDCSGTANISYIKGN